MSDEYAETDEWPLPRYTGSSKVPATFHPSETPTVTRGPEWRDRGLIIAQQQTRIAQLEAQIARVEAVANNPTGDCEGSACIWPEDLREALS